MKSHNETSHFLTEDLMFGGDWKAFELAVCRLLTHCGWTNLQYIGQPGDKGADILAIGFDPTTKTTTSFLFQVKSVTSSSHIGKPARFSSSHTFPTYICPAAWKRTAARARERERDSA
ncbi:MAG TPA: hypothetical protein DEB39_03280 [Planctomycetaceae bacterium]|nr:hypothetical protein [Planctomycetaceae bacterium]